MHPLPGTLLTGLYSRQTFTFSTWKTGGFGLFNAVGNTWKWRSDYCGRDRNAARAGFPPDTSTRHIGFRVARDI